MGAEIRYYSTNRGAAAVTLAEALLRGQPADRGLFLPERFPTLDQGQLAALRGRPYWQVAWEVLRPYAAGLIDQATLGALCRQAYDYEVPLEHVAGRRYLLRLDRGPSASFKDLAAGMMARWLSALLRRRGGALLVLVATSGDTGGAVAQACRGLEHIRVVVLFPPAGVSQRQRRQMTTVGGNVAAVGLAGKFDDCQALVKRALADRELDALRLTSANSINIGRLLPQAVYYVYAYVNLADVGAGEPIVFGVPSGNFGNMMGAVIAGRMGLPLERLVVATNANDEFPVFLRTGRYRKVSPARLCLSSAMNVGHPSNLARLVDLYGGWMDEGGAIRQRPDMQRLRRDIYAVSIDDDQTRATIRQAYARYGVVLEPHGAVGWAGLEHYRRDCVRGAEPLTVAIETAHPAKFPEQVRALTGVDPPAPPSLARLAGRPETYERLPAEYERFRRFLLERYA